MINMFISFLMMIFYSFLSFFLSMCLMYLDKSFLVEWMLYSMNSMNFMLIILIDWVSMLFSSLVMLISAMVMMYSTVYMNSEKFLSRFWYLVLLFIFSMILMIISPSIISILFGWDGLGVVSYCLVIYYQNYSSYNSGMATVLSNRIGDIGLLMSIGLLSMCGSWNLWLYNDYMLIVSIMLMLAAITKSAQIPFSSWLPMAMAAPTPVSALVHSSTLVTAGVYLMIRFNKLLVGTGINYYLLYISVLTMFMSGVMANFEYDLKKIIALSTLSQLGLMMMILSFGYENLAFFHLLIHAVFKSMLFMCAGIIIHSMNNCQDIRLIGNLSEVIPFTMMSFLVASMALCGFPFMAGFYSKDLIMEIVYISMNNILLIGLMVLSLMFTVTYSVRLFYYLFFMKLKYYSFMNFAEDSVMNISMFILVTLSVLIGSLFSWIFFFDFYLIHLELSWKLLTLVICIMGVVVMCLGVIMLVKTFKGIYCMNYYLGSMWFLNTLYSNIYYGLNLFSFDLFISDKVWIEFFSKYKVLDLVYSEVNVLNNFYFKIYMFTFVFVSMMYILCLFF